MHDCCLTVDDGTVPKTEPGPRLWQVVRHVGHALEPPCHHHTSVTQRKTLRGENHRFHSRRADLVNAREGGAGQYSLTCTKYFVGYQRRFLDTLDSRRRRSCPWQSREEEGGGGGGNRNRPMGRWGVYGANRFLSLSF